MKKSDKIISWSVIVFFLLIILAMLGGSGNKKLSGSGRIGLIDLSGVIMSTDKFTDQLNDYIDRKDISAIIVRINSPGGGVAQSHELYAAIKSAAAKKALVAYIAGMGASGGYYAALGASRIMANPASVTGSIGVIISMPGFGELLDKLGIDQRTVKSGRFKDIGSPYRDFLPEDSLRFQVVVDDLYDQFLTLISNEREIPKKDLKKIADGRIFTGCQAFNLGLVDSLGTFENAIELTAELAGLSGKPEIVTRPRRKITLLDVLFSDIDEIYGALMKHPVFNYF